MMLQAGPMALVGSLGAVSKVVLLALFIFSVISWAIILYKWRAFRKSDKDDQRFLQLYARTPEKDELRRLAKRYGHSPSAALFMAVMDRLAPEADSVATALSPAEPDAPDRQYLDRVIGHVMQDQIGRQETYLPFLATTGNITPFVGLLGTVLGIIDAFREIGKSGTASIAAVAPGVSEALVATAAGLCAAIPAVIAYNYYLARIRKSAFRVEAFSIELLNFVQSRMRQVGIRG
ncbi:MAG TPA: MotA/TolQ/ExbB proton channel family protein [Nitrospiraceae bacterium]|jgi:biopolymer transport protein TolQ|nr:MotA/TolQ/ExbB proton channel family protein [Nitrospiraceae bacterium]